MPADSTDDFLASAARLFDTARPWLTSALAEHSAHPSDEPGACRLCALRGALIRGAEPFAVLAAESLGHFADEVLDDLRVLVEELLDALKQIYVGVAADYLATVHGATAPAAPDESSASPRRDEPAPAPRVAGASSTGGGYERIDITLGEDDGEGR